MNETFSIASTEDPENLFDSPNETGSPERRLFLAVLERSILDYVGNDKKEMKDAEEWIFSDFDNDKPEEFSFAWICQQLDLDARRTAKIIAAMPKRGKHKVAPWYFMKHNDDKVNQQIAA